MEDVVNRCLMTSDPVILQHMAAELGQKRPEKNPSASVMRLIAEPKEPPFYMIDPNETDILNESTTISESDSSDSDSMSGDSNVYFMSDSDDDVNMQE